MRIAETFRRRPRGVRLAPLIDVVFILLLLFMLTTGFVPWREIEVAFPAPGEETAVSEIVAVRVLDGGRTLFIEGERYAADDAAALAALVQERGDAVYAVRGYDRMRTQVLVDVVDGLRQAGALQVSLAKSSP